MAALLFVLAVLIGVYGLVCLFQGNIVAGLLLIVLAFLVGPGGYSIFR